ncbi:hypothetical protein [Mycoplasma sp. SG1]|uniref:hypothetical protein n=1 Tax=Mycoplasma sp. SG1 TaxID=2810348 RepID=UPI002025A2D0|nr:hypothetical protein [Mycoplasma sp. SG1]URM53053.1 hypothetical protein JRW51_01765 [Mycoplasma sp. SG1]
MKQKGLIFLILQLFVLQLQDIKASVSTNSSFTSEDLSMLDESVLETLKSLSKLQEKINKFSDNESKLKSNPEDLFPIEEEFNDFNTFFIDNLDNKKLRKEFSKLFKQVISNNSKLSINQRNKNSRKKIKQGKISRRPKKIQTGFDDTWIVEYNNKFNNINTSIIKKNLLDLFFKLFLKFDINKKTLIDDEPFLLFEQLINQYQNIDDRNVNDDVKKLFKEIKQKITETKAQGNPHQRAEFLYHYFDQHNEHSGQGTAQFLHFLNMVSDLYKSSDARIFNNLFDSLKPKLNKDEVSQIITFFKTNIKKTSDFNQNKKLSSILETADKKPIYINIFHSQNTREIFPYYNWTQDFLEYLKQNYIREVDGSGESKNPNFTPSIIVRQGTNHSHVERYLKKPNENQIFIILDNDFYEEFKKYSNQDNFVVRYFTHLDNYKEFFYSLINSVIKGNALNKYLNPLKAANNDGDYYSDYLAMVNGQDPWFVQVLEQFVNNYDESKQPRISDVIMPDYKETIDEQFYLNWIKYFIFVSYFGNLPNNNQKLYFWLLQHFYKSNLNSFDLAVQRFVMLYLSEDASKKQQIMINFDKIIQNLPKLQFINSHIAQIPERIANSIFNDWKAPIHLSQLKKYSSIFKDSINFVINKEYEKTMFFLTSLKNASWVPDVNNQDTFIKNLDKFFVEYAEFYDTVYSYFEFMELEKKQPLNALSISSYIEQKISIHNQYTIDLLELLVVLYTTLKGQLNYLSNFTFFQRADTNFFPDQNSKYHFVFSSLEEIKKKMTATLDNNISSFSQLSTFLKTEFTSNSENGEYLKRRWDNLLTSNDFLLEPSAKILIAQGTPLNDGKYNVILRKVNSNNITALTNKKNEIKRLSNQKKLFSNFSELQSFITTDFPYYLQKFNTFYLEWFTAYKTMFANLFTLYRWTEPNLSESEWEDNIYFGLFYNTTINKKDENLDDNINQWQIWLKRVGGFTITNYSGFNNDIKSFFNFIEDNNLTFDKLLLFDKNRSNYTSLKLFYLNGFKKGLRYILDYLKQIIYSDTLYSDKNDPLKNWFNDYWISKQLQDKDYDDIFSSSKLDDYLNNRNDKFLYNPHNRIIELFDPVMVNLFESSIKEKFVLPRRWGNNNVKFLSFLSLMTKNELQKLTSFGPKEVLNVSKYEYFKDEVDKILSIQSEYKNRFIEHTKKYYQDFYYSKDFLGYDYFYYKDLLLFFIEKLNTYEKVSAGKEASIGYMLDSLDRFKTDFAKNQTFDPIKEFFKLIPGITSKDELSKFLSDWQIKLHQLHIYFWKIVDTLHFKSDTKDSLAFINLRNNISDLINKHTSTKQNPYFTSPPQDRIRYLNPTLDESKNYFKRTFLEFNLEYNKMMVEKINSFYQYVVKIRNTWKEEELFKNQDYFGFYDDQFTQKLKRNNQNWWFTGDQYLPKKIDDILKRFENLLKKLKNEDRVLDGYKFKKSEYIELFKNTNFQASTIIQDIHQLMQSIGDQKYSVGSLYLIFDQFNNKNSLFLKMLQTQGLAKNKYISGLSQYYVIPDGRNANPVNLRIYQGLGYDDFDPNNSYNQRNLINQIKSKNFYSDLKIYDQDEQEFNNFIQFQIKKLKEHIDEIKLNFIDSENAYFGLGYDKKKELNFKFNFNFDATDILNTLHNFISDYPSLKNKSNSRVLTGKNYLNHAYNTASTIYDVSRNSFDPFEVLNNFILEQKKVFLADLNNFYNSCLKNKRYSIFRFKDDTLKYPVLDFHKMKFFIDNWNGLRNSNKLLLNGKNVLAYDFLAAFYKNQSDFENEQSDLINKDNIPYQHIFFKKKEGIFGLDRLAPHINSKVSKNSVFNNKTTTTYDNYIDRDKWDKLNVMSFKRIEVNNRVFFSLLNFYGYAIVIETSPNLTANQFQQYLQNNSLTPINIKYGILYKPSLGDPRIGVKQISNQNFKVSKTVIEFEFEANNLKTFHRFQLHDDIKSLYSFENDSKLKNLFFKHQTFGIMDVPYPALIAYSKRDINSDYKVNSIVIPNRCDESRTVNQKVYDTFGSNVSNKIFNEGSIYTIQFLNNPTLKELKSVNNTSTRTFYSHFYQQILGEKILNIIVSAQNPNKPIIEQDVIALDLLQFSNLNNKIPFDKLTYEEINSLLPDILKADIPDDIASKFPAWAIYLLSCIGGGLLAVPSLWFFQKRVRTKLLYKSKISKIDNMILKRKTGSSATQKVNKKSMTLQDLVKRKQAIKKNRKP